MKLAASGSLLFGELPAGVTDLTIEHSFCHCPMEIARGLGVPKTAPPAPKCEESSDDALRMLLEQEGLLR